MKFRLEGERGMGKETRGNVLFRVLTLVARGAYFMTICFAYGNVQES